MKNRIGYLLLCLLVTAFCFTAIVSCQQEPSPIVVLVESSYSLDSLEAGQKVAFRVNTFANDSRVERCLVKETTVDYGTRTLLDTLVQVDRAQFSYIYTTPTVDVNQECELTFLSISSNGQQDSYVIRFDLIGALNPLKEYSSFSLYSPYSAKPDAFNLSNRQLLIKASADSAAVDLYVNKLPLAEGETLNSIFSAELRSNTALSFIRYNDFNYPEATQKSLNNAYAAGTPLSWMSSIKNNDIILIGRGHKALGVIKILVVNEADGAVDDYITFSWKTMP